MAVKTMEATLTLGFALEKETPGTYRYKEDATPGTRPTIGTLYITKTAFKTGAPGRVTVSVMAG